MVEEDLGEATIVYEDPDDGTVERQVQNEYVAYFQDHWIIKTDEDQQGQDHVRRIPFHRVYYVDRSVEEFEEEVSTLKTQVQSIADDLRQRVMGGSDGGRMAGEEPARTRSGSASSSGGGSDDAGGQEETTSPSQ